MQQDVTYVGSVEITTGYIAADVHKVTRTRIGENVMHVTVEGTDPITLDPWTSTFYEYAHRDHLGSIELVTDGAGNVVDHLAFEAFGARKSADWSGNASAAEVDALLGASASHSPKVRGFTGHEHLDRTGFIHMNGRLYDPKLGRFLSPDPIVQAPAYSQSHNRYSYVFNAPTSLVDPTGYVAADSGLRVEVNSGWTWRWGSVDYYDPVIGTNGATLYMPEEFGDGRYLNESWVADETGYIEEFEVKPGFSPVSRFDP